MIFSESELIDSINEKNIENFNKNGGVNMYIYKVSDDETTSAKNTVLEKIKEIDSKYSTEEYIPTELKSLGLEKMEYQAPSRDEIEAEAASSLKSYKEDGLNSIDDKYSSKFSTLSEKASKALEEKERDESLLDSKYENLVNKSTNTNIKKGLSRSSIYDNALKEIESYREGQVNVIEQEYQKEVSRLENERSILEQQKEGALSSFDISYAVKLQNKISSLNNDIAKQQEKILKYNNDVAKKEANYLAEQEKAATKEQERIAKQNQALLDLISKKGITEINKLKAQEKYNVFSEYFEGLNKADAMEELNSNARYYENELGSYYALLYANMSKRKG